MKAKNWIIDPSHSEIQFRVKHLLIANVSGEFRIFSGKMTVSDPDVFSDGIIEGIIDVYSLDTNETDRDNHLKSAEFLDSDQFPDIFFKGTDFKHVSGDDFNFTAHLTIKGITKEIPFKMIFGGQMKDGFGNEKAALELVGKINRKDFDIHYNSKTDAGSLIVGEEIRLNANLQFIRQD